MIHKSSRFVAEEAEGFVSAATARDLAALDLVWITDSEDVQLFRHGAAITAGTLLWAWTIPWTMCGPFSQGGTAP